MNATVIERGCKRGVEQVCDIISSASKKNGMVNMAELFDSQEFKEQLSGIVLQQISMAVLEDMMEKVSAAKS